MSFTITVLVNVLYVLLQRQRRLKKTKSKKKKSWLGPRSGSFKGRRQIWPKGIRLHNFSGS